MLFTYVIWFFLEGFAVLFQFRGRRNATGLAVFGALCCVFVREKQVAGLQLDRHQNRKKHWACRMLDLRNVKGQTNNGSCMHVPENACLVSFMHAWQLFIAYFIKYDLGLYTCMLIVNWRLLYLWNSTKGLTWRCWRHNWTNEPDKTGHIRLYAFYENRLTKCIYRPRYTMYDMLLYIGQWWHNSKHTTTHRLIGKWWDEIQHKEWMHKENKMYWSSSSVS